MKYHPSLFRSPSRIAAAALALCCAVPPLRAQLLSNLQSFPDRIAVGDPQTQASENKEGPKGIASADFNGDGKPDLAAGNLDGTITVLMGLGSGSFSPPQHLHTNALELRSVIGADLNGDGKPDLAAASPMDGKLLVYFNPGSGNFGAATPLEGWIGVRALAAGDFDGDGIKDLAAAGPGLGVRHFRGTGGGAFQIMGDLPRLSPVHPALPRPVYALGTLRSRDGLRDDLLVTHADSAALYILSTVPVDRSAEPPMDMSRLPAWSTRLTAPVLIHEFQVMNATTLHDADGSAQPWVELLNKSATAVDLAGWKLKSGTKEWTLPAMTILPGRMLVIFLSGKNRSAGLELHTSFLLQQNDTELRLLRPDATEANSFTLAPHTVADVSHGLAPDLDAVKYFDIPSPGMPNNAGLNNLDDIPAGGVTTLTMTPREPTAAQSVTVRVTTPPQPTGSSAVRNVWFSAMAATQEVHHLLHKTAPGTYETVLTPGTITGSTPHRVLARLWDGTGNDYTAEIHRGLDEAVTNSIAAPRAGRLQPVASLPSPKVKAFETGHIRTASGAPGAAPDLVYADEACGLLQVHPASQDARRFSPLPSQAVPVRGAPRDVKLADTDGDGWLDATVVLRSLDLALTVRNEAGLLRATGELPTGRSPREAVMADFTGDGKPDAAIINRYSADISILPTAANHAGLVSMDQIYPVNGEVAGLTVRDVNGDGRDDVIQLHRASGEISTRLAGPDGSLGPPVFRTVGTAPSGLTTADVNGDGRPDMLTANLGGGGNGSISVLLAKPDGTYEAPRSFPSGGGMFAISVADFDSDGNQDVVAGLFDCRVAFFRGDGTGNFTSTYSVTFVYESRVMVTGDFDQDGDTDVAGAGYAGDMVTLENRGAATAAGWFKRTYPAPSGTTYGTERIAITSLNTDTDPDLIIGTGQGVITYTGAPGMDFTLAPQYDGGMGFSVSDVLIRDLDGDGMLEMVASCRSASCINILTQNAAGEFTPVTQADVPSGRYLASGDLDGDGRPDIVGTGDALWTVLSSRPAQTAPPGNTTTTRPQTSDVVINELLGQNTGVPLTADNGRKTDFLEVFNGATTPAVLTGWKLRLQATQEGTAVDQTWTLPAVTVGAKSYALVIFSAEPGTMHTGFTLPAEGGTVTLLRPDDSTADTVTYPPAQENVSWSRYLDGHPSFRADRIPSPGMSNLDNGTVPPEVKLTPPSPATLVAGQAIRFTAKGTDDAGIISLSLLWNRIDAPYADPQRVVLYDDGMHQDAGAVDGVFSGQMSTPLPSGAEVQFYLEAVDLSGETLLLPDSAELTAPGAAPVAWSFSLTTPPALEITEVSANNINSRRDDLGGHPDYITVQNTGGTAQDMSTVLLAKSPLAADSAMFLFPPGLTLPPGGEVTVYADGNPSQGPLHAPFTLDAGGDDVSLLATRPSGARQWIHSLPVPSMPVDAQFSKLPGTSLRAVLAPADNPANWSGVSYSRDGTAFATVTFTAVPGFNYTLQGDAPGTPVSWAFLASFPADGTTRTLTRPLTQMESLRIYATAAGPFITRVDSLQVADTAAGLFGEAAPSASSLTLFYGPANGGTNPAAWANSMESPGPVFAFQPAGLLPNTRYYYVIRATHTAPGVTTPVVTWTNVGYNFLTLPSTASRPKALTLLNLKPTDFRVEIAVSPIPPPGTTVTLLAGTTDAFTNVPAWFCHMPAFRTGRTDATSEYWEASLAGLERETDYYVRAVLSNGTVSAHRLKIHMPGARDNVALNLRLSEIMYHPPWSNAAEEAAGFVGDDFEFIELHNASSVSMDLSGLWFEAGLDFDFPPGGAPVIPPDGYAVIAANPHAFAMRYGSHIPLAGWTLHPFRRARLANSGEFITLRAADGTLLFSMAYNDEPSHTDGRGFSLEYRPPANPFAPEVADDYYASRVTGGTPGAPPLAAADLDFAGWKALHFTATESSNPAISGERSDPDRDGLDNFMEFACGTDPRRPGSPNLLQFTGPGDDGSLRLTFPVSLRAKARLRLLSSTSLASDWNLAFSYGSSDVWGYDLPIVPSGEGDQLILQLWVWLGNPRVFFRLEADPE